MRSTRPILFAVALVSALTLPATSHARRCPADSVQVGDVCVDKYEASVWSTTDAATIRKIQHGKLTSSLEIVGAQHGTASDDYGAACPDTGRGCTDFYAVSIPGVLPSAHLTQFQAMAACRNAGKHLTTNQEWQAAALGTPDAGPTTVECNTGVAEGVVSTGSFANCVSDVAAFDMVGNLEEWVADWIPASTICRGWGGFSDDSMCVSGASTTEDGPHALVRGGYHFSGAFGGPFAVHRGLPWGVSSMLGFRCARRL